VAVANTAAFAQDPPGDPPGNNGTIKIVADSTSDVDPGSEPQLEGCLVWLEFYGYDLNQQADITFSAIPPSGEAQLLSYLATVSDDPAGGGQDKDATLAFNLTAALQGVASDPERGYHIKVASNTVGAPGGAKQKVFWMRCTTVGQPGTLQVSKSVEGAGAGPFAFALRCNHSLLDRTFTLASGESVSIPGVPGDSVCVVTESSSGGATTTRITESPALAGEDGQVNVAGGGATSRIGFVNVFPVAVLGDGLGRPDGSVAAATLPRTGAPTGMAASVGIGLLALGMLVRQRVRRSQAGGQG
jgi:hypothetical protein